MNWINVKKVVTPPTTINLSSEIQMAMNLSADIQIAEHELPTQPSKLGWIAGLLTVPKVRLMSNVYWDFSLTLLTEEGCEVDVEFNDLELKKLLNSILEMEDSKLFMTVKIKDTTNTNQFNELTFNIKNDDFWKFWCLEVDELVKAKSIEDIRMILPEQLFFETDDKKELRISMTLNPEVNHQLREYIQTGNKPNLKGLSERVVYFRFNSLTECVDYNTVKAFAELIDRRLSDLNNELIRLMNTRQLIRKYSELREQRPKKRTFDEVKNKTNWS
jgi:hypothetical protein